MSISNWIEILKAAGIDSRRLSIADIYFTEGQILRDDVVSARVRAVVTGRGGCASHGTYVEVIESMPEPERAALRERVTRV